MHCPPRGEYNCSDNQQKACRQPLEETWRERLPAGCFKAECAAVTVYSTFTSTVVVACKDPLVPVTVIV